MLASIWGSLPLLALGAMHAATGQSAPSSTPQEAGIVHVAPPTGEKATDRASILAALQKVEPGGTVRFAPGTYLIGPIIPVTTSEITLLGHAEGTTIRGCDADAFKDQWAATFACHGIGLSGARQTVRNLTFEYT
ncbi:MAG TPA: hypothetical protein VMT16_13625, partial [Thermoanaerobaculia bacterium]|nr:hypothetical protein [Thermoanaerobaculia bacterium]